jgi:tetratricopeptide (TPR) repeat protein
LKYRDTIKHSTRATTLCLAILFLSVCSGHSEADAQNAGWQQSLNEAKKAAARKDYSQAETLLQSAAKKASSLKPTDVNWVKIYNAQLELAYAKNDMSKAADIFARILPLLRNHYGVHSREYAETLHNYSAVLKTLGRTDEFKKIVKDAESIENPHITLGYIDKKGTLRIKWSMPFDHFSNCYQLPGPYSDGLAAVYQGNPECKCAYINNEGQAVIPEKWDRGAPFREGRAEVYSGSDIALIDKLGQTIIAPSHAYFPTQRSEGLWPSSSGRLYFDDTGKEALSVPYNSIRSFHEGLAGVAGMRDAKDVNESWGFINKSGKLAIPLQFLHVKDFSQGMAPVQQLIVDKTFHRDWGYINNKGQLIVGLKYQWADMFSEGLACVGAESDQPMSLLYGFIDKAGREVIPFKFDWAEPFKEGMALVHVPGTHDLFDYVFINGKGGFIDKSGHWEFINSAGKVVFVVSADAQEVSSFSDGLAMVRVAGKYGYLGKDGTFAIKPKFQWADSFSEGAAAVALW